MSYYKPEQVKVIRLGDVPQGGIYAARIRGDYSYKSYRLILSEEDTHREAFGIALDNGGSPMASRDGFALFNKN